MSSKRKKKIARKQSAQIPAWLRDRHVPVHLKREVEDALARHAAVNGIAIGSAKFKSITLQDLCASLKIVHGRWRAVRPEMFHAATQPGTKALAAHLQECKKKRKMVEQMVAEIKAAADVESPSSQGSAEEGEGEEEEAQAGDSDRDLADPKPTYAEGSPQELLRAGPHVQKAEEGAADG